MEEALQHCREVDALLLDSGNRSLPVKELGGTGRTHDWVVSARFVNGRAFRSFSPVGCALTTSARRFEWSDRSESIFAPAFAPQEPWTSRSSLASWQVSQLPHVEDRMSEVIRWPSKTRELHNHHFDSTIWNDFASATTTSSSRPTPSRARPGCSRSSRSCCSTGIPDLEVAEMSPWLDLRVPPKEVKLPVVEAQTHRRFLKTHLPVDALRLLARRPSTSTSAATAATWSGACTTTTPTRIRPWYEALNDTPGRVGPPIEPPPDDIRQYWRDWLDRDGHPFWPFWENVRSWWADSRSART